MYWHEGDRRRLIVAAVVTVVALPFLWTSKRTSPSAPNGQVAVVTPNSDLGGAGVVAASDVAASTPAYLQGSDISAAPAPVVIDIAPPGSKPDAVGSATFRQIEGSSSLTDPPCWSSQAPFGITIVVTNTENGFKIRCTNINTNPLPPGYVIVINSDDFGQLADLTEAPIPVELNWQ